MKASIWATNEVIEVITDRANMRSPSRSTGTRGRGLPNSRNTSRAPTARPPTTSSAPTIHARVRVRMSTPVMIRPKVKALSTALIQSKRRPDSGLSGSARWAMARAARPSGTFTANSHGQGPTDRIAAAAVGPIAAEAEMIIAFSPIPRPSNRCG